MSKIRWQELFLEERRSSELRWNAQGRVGMARFLRGLSCLPEGQDPRCDYIAVDGSSADKLARALDPPVDLMNYWPNQHPLEEWWTLEHLEPIEQLAQTLLEVLSADSLEDVSILFTGWEQAIVWVAPEDQKARDVREHAQIIVFYRAGGQSQRAFSHWQGFPLSGWLISPNGESQAVQIREGVQRFVSAKLTAQPVVGPQTDLILAGNAAASLFHKIAHLLEAEQPGAQDLIGQRVAPAFLSLIDDPSWPGLAGSMRVDDEGIPTHPTVLISEGIVSSLLHGRRTAQQANRLSNGHARRESFLHPILPRVSNTFVQPCRGVCAEDLIAEISKGIYVNDLTHVAINPRTRSVYLSLGEAYWIEHGRRTDHACSGQIRLHDPWELLHRVDAVAQEVVIKDGGGLCSKKDQQVAVAAGAPAVRLRQVRIG